MCCARECGRTRRNVYFIVQAIAYNTCIHINYVLLVWFLLPHTVVTVSLSPSSYVVYEEDGSVTVQLVKSGETQLPVEVLLSTVDGTASGKHCYYIINIRLYRLTLGYVCDIYSLTKCNYVSCVLIAPGDFVGVTNDIITFLADQTVLTAAVVLVDDVIAEEEEEFLFVSLSSSSQGVRVGEGDATITVRDRDSEWGRWEKIRRNVCASGEFELMCPITGIKT